MKFTPKTKEEVESSGLIPNKTECDFEVMSAESAQSKAGNDMIKLKLTVWHDDKPHTVFDYLMESVQFKLLHFCETAGLTKQYASGSLSAAECNGKQGRCVVKVEPAKDSYPAKNSIGDYIGHRKSGPAAVKAAEDKPADDLPY